MKNANTATPTQILKDAVDTAVRDLPANQAIQLLAELEDYCSAMAAGIETTSAALADEFRI